MSSIWASKNVTLTCRSVYVYYQGSSPGPNRRDIMKKYIGLMFALLVGASTALAKGGKSQGDTGTGKTSTIEDFQGQAEQGRKIIWWLS